jgi:hypothetical protein
MHNTATQRHYRGLLAGLITRNVDDRNALDVVFASGALDEQLIGIAEAFDLAEHTINEKTRLIALEWARQALDRIKTDTAQAFVLPIERLWFSVDDYLKDENRETSQPHTISRLRSAAYSVAEHVHDKATMLV